MQLAAVRPSLLAVTAAASDPESFSSAGSWYYRCTAASKGADKSPAPCETVQIA